MRKLAVVVPSATAVSVDYMAQSGSATVGSDFGIAFGTLAFQSWETEKTVAVDVYGSAVGFPPLAGCRPASIGSRDYARSRRTVLTALG